ncbi:MAG: helix-turn-helix domain-containing protein [Pseudanabaenaceae cyanobacterium bins.39]|nr:helix-turn-helix domain-containing protein [Pseudanabaenaceae cyanobacterium bins.39]
MINLQISSDKQWTLDELAVTTNEMLPQVLPTLKPNAKLNTKLSEEITPRLIRYYTNQGVLDDPIREGKYAFYNQRHLLQLLVCRRLLTEGFTVAVIQAIAKHKTNDELESMLTGGIEFNLSAAHPDTESKNTKNDNPKIITSQWLRIQIREGVEIHWRSDVTLPQTSLEYQHFLAEVERALIK